MAWKISLFQLIFTFALILSNTAAAQSNGGAYCSRSLCNQKHIACGNNEQISSTCARNSEIIGLTPDIKGNIVRKHNEYRNMLALGKVPNFRPATRMGTMQWHEELARMADLNVKSCTGGHDACRNTFDFRYSGQNIASTFSSYSLPSDQIITFLYHAVDLWFNEHQICPQNEKTLYTSRQERCGHFTVMIADRNVYVGCAAILMNRKKIVFTCNYAWTNMIGMVMYAPGPTASECRTGYNGQYAGLCSVGENYDLMG